MSNEPQDAQAVDEMTDIADEQVDTAAEPVTDAINTDDADQVQRLTDEIADLKEQALRAVAEAQNARRRAEQEVEKARKFALERFVSELLPVADNLERAIAACDAADESQKAVIEGIGLTHKSFLDTLKKFQVEPVDPEGLPFDPQLHQAMSMVPSPDVEPNTVLTVFQKGYTLHGRLVRPAMVVVASSPPIDQTV